MELFDIPELISNTVYVIGDFVALVNLVAALLLFLSGFADQAIPEKTHLLLTVGMFVTNFAVVYGVIHKWPTELLLGTFFPLSPLPVIIAIVLWFVAAIFSLWKPFR